MGHATKGGMHCLRCDKPVAAQKTTHGVRNAAAALTTILVAKVDQWHCPHCGGPVTTSAGAKVAKQKDAKNEARRQRMVDTRREVGDDPVTIVITKLRAPDKKPTAWRNHRVHQLVCETRGAKWSRSKTKEVTQELENLPLRIDGFQGGLASRLVRELREAGATVEMEQANPT